ncbi:MAG: exodeoxyribonuclease VII large subunit [Methylocystaceae bacterium]
MPLFEPLPALTISELALIIKENLEADLRLNNVWVKGEIADFKLHRASGHCYFTLKDEFAVLPAVMFRKKVQNLDFQPEDGLTVLARGSIGVYEKSGRYQLYVEEMEPYGWGQLALQLEQLKKRLEAEGLFNLDRKKALPAMPRVIGIVTSRDGAAVKDILRVVYSRFPAIEVLLAPVLVQGQDAPQSIAQGIASLNSQPEVDVIIVGRGGGSYQDLFAFNSEEVVRAVASSQVPIISAVGHEVDTTLCDLAADIRAATPTQAGVLVVPELVSLQAELKQLSARVIKAMGGYLDKKQIELDNLSGSRMLAEPENVLLPRQEQLSQLLSSRVFQEPENLLMGLEERLRSWMERLILAGRQREDKMGKELASLTAQLDALSPLKVLGRGYTLVSSTDGPLVLSRGQVKTGDQINIRWYDGEAAAIINEAERGSLFE